MKLLTFSRNAALAIALSIFSLGAASAQTATVKITEGAKFDGYKIAHVAITADAAQGHGFVNLLLAGLTDRGLEAKLGFAPKDVPLDGVMTLFIQEFAADLSSFQFYVQDAKTEKGLAKIIGGGPQVTLAQQEAMVASIMDQMFGKKAE